MCVVNLVISDRWSDMKTRPTDCLTTRVIISFGNRIFTTLAPILLNPQLIGI